MKKLLLLVLITAVVYTHSGRTDSSGGHNCSAKSKAKGLCTGYHYHNGSSRTSRKTSANSRKGKTIKKSKTTRNKKK